MTQVLTVLISGCAALLGSAIGLAANVITSKQGTKRRLWEERQHAYAKLVECYETYIIAPHKWGQKSKEETEADCQFRYAYYNAILLCEKSTADLLTTLMDQINSFGNNYPTLPPGYKTNAAYEAAVEAMKEELTTNL